VTFIPDAEKKEQQLDQTFRDTIGTVDEAGDRVWLYPKKPKGRFYNARTYVSWLLLVIFFSGPFISVSGRPLLLMNFFERKFIILGVAFWPQDFYLFVLAMITFVVFIVLFTAVFGRVWCGWACPQTVFMEMVYRKIEYLIEGDAGHQRKLNQQPMNTQKFFKKFLKQSIFAVIAFAIGNIFMAYIVGKEEWFLIISSSPTDHLSGFIAVLVFSGIFYFVFANFREQACVIVCPYGRFQSVLLDKSSIVVSYDFVRGEKRGKLSKKKEPIPDQGDCVDCNQCVEVCPTGIDIRHGTQLECVNCTACIDACDNVMDKVKRPRGLIRYSSYTAIVEGVKKLITPRIIVYSAILLLLVTILSTLLIMRSPVDVTILRTPGTLYTTLQSGDISNIYSIEIVNKTFEDMPLQLKLNNKAGKLSIAGGKMLMKADKISKSVLIIEMPKSALVPGRNTIYIDVISNDEVLKHYKTSFLAPDNVND